MGQSKSKGSARDVTGQFLAGGGEMGALMRAHDWSHTPLGPPCDWPQSLKTAVRIMLTSRQPIWIGWGPELTYLYNDPYKSIIGGKHPWALGRPTSQVWSEIWSDIEPMLQTALGGAEGTYVEQQQLIMQRHGYPEETYYTFSYSPIPDDDDGVGGIICANTDNTAQVINERQIALLRELAARTSTARSWKEACERSAEALATDSPDLPFSAIYILDREREVLSLAAQQGVEPGHRAAPEHVRLKDWPAAAKALERGEPELVSEIRTRFGKVPAGAWPDPPRELAFLPIPAAGENGRTGVLMAGLNPYRQFDDGYRGFLELVSGQVSAALANAQAYEEERLRAEKLADIDRAKTAFFSNVSHEFRTPLTLMLGPLEEALADPNAGVDLRNHIEVAHRNGLRLLRLVNTLLDFSRIEAGRAQARFRPADLGQMVVDLASTFRSATDRAGLTLELLAEPMLEPVYVDPGMIEKIVLNLISNAFKFTLQGGIKVSVRPRLQSGEVEIEVADSGVGIPAEEIPRLFERFHRVQGTKGRSFEGTGIGLALVHELVQLHGGSIEVESLENRGSTFRVILPLGPGHLDADHIDGGGDVIVSVAGAGAFAEEALHWLPDSQALNKPAPLPPTDASDRRCILLADDNSDMRDYVARLLEGAGFEVISAPDGEAALKAMRSRRPDLVLTDVMMPHLDGLGLLRTIREDPGLADLPVIMLSARAGEDATIQGLDSGADDYLSKPFSARDLIARVRTNLTLAQARREASAMLASRTAKLQALLDTAPVCIFFTDEADAGAVRSNRFAVDLLGLKSADDNPFVAGPGAKGPVELELWRDGVPIDPQAGPLQRAARGQELRDEEMEVRFADGKGVHLLMNAAPLKDEQGALCGAVAVALDISHRKLADAQREAAHRELQALNATLESRVSSAVAERRVLADIVEGTDAFVQVADLDFRWLAVNGAAAAEFERIYGVRPQVGRTMLEVLSNQPEHQQAVRAVWARALGGEEFTEISAFGDPGRDRRWYEMKFNVLRDAHGERIGAFQFVYDVTNRIVEQERLARAEEQLRQAQKMEAMGQLTGGVAHDFNNLLTPIIGVLDRLKRTAHITEREGLLVEGALQSADRARILVQRLLAFARRQPLQPVAVDVGALVKNMAHLVASTAGPQIHVSVDAPSDISPAKGDPNQLEMALLNLSVNARDAMPNGGALRITVSNEIVQPGQRQDLAPGLYVRLSVADTGVGMDEKTLARAVEPFFSTKGLGKGTGLGLSMAHGLAQQLGGALTVQSRLGLGTNVELWLPQSDETPSPAETCVTMTDRGGVKGIALLVDDEDAVRTTISDMLSELGYKVVEVASAEEAVRRIEAGLQASVVVTDHLMPGMTGIDLAHAVKARAPDTPVLIISGYAEMEGVDPGLPRLTKPFLNSELANALSAFR